LSFIYGVWQRCNVHAGGGLQVAQVQLDVPALCVQLRQVVLADPPVIKQRGA